MGNLRHILPLGNTAHPDTIFFMTTPDSIKYAMDRIVLRNFIPCFDISDSDELYSTEQLREQFVNMVPDKETITLPGVFSAMVASGFEQYSNAGVSLWMLKKVG